MGQFNTYVFVLCIIIFIALTMTFSFMVVTMGKQLLTMVSHGIEDEKIKEEYFKKKDDKKSKFLGTVEKIVPIFFSAIFIIVFAFLMYSNATQNNIVKKCPVIKVVASGSMSYKYDGNDYLFENNLNNQIMTFDLIVTHKLPKEEELNIYDIVVYEVDGNLLVHRIIEIEEPNEQHPNERYFRLQGDAVEFPDRFPVHYEQMRSIYKGTRIPFLGSFVYFLQSPAGMMCIILVVCAMILFPIFEKKYNTAKFLRLVAMGILDVDGREVVVVTKDTEEKEETVEVIEEVTKKKRKKPLTFKEKLARSSDLLKARYKDIVTHAESFEGIQSNVGNRHHTIRYKNKSVAKILIKERTLCVYLSLNPEEYNETEYIYRDVSDVKTHKNHPMLLSVTSNHKHVYVKELITEIIAIYNK